MFPEIDHILVTREQIAERVRELGERIARDINSDRDTNPGVEVVIIPILTGALVLAADLIRELPLRLSLRVVAVSSYPGASIASKGAKISGDLPCDLCGKHVLIIDDILDSGQTIGLVKELIAGQGPASLRTCVLLRKPESVRVRPVEVEYVGFDIPNHFVVGYGLDYDGFYRNYPQIATLRPEAIAGDGSPSAA
ncbi:MAG: hypoxanthine phosphoribosyltransferase [Phycisphaeraceae bacterium]|nr:hypoxanthine phosphoribosyltransferase [Phycisphaerae bacterium]MBX3393450.1 hypoxanthine phosphoribosyltransferase [Phycisphaeraceae bacterium]